jgi:type IV secretion system protein VirD4
LTEGKDHGGLAFGWAVGAAAGIAVAAYLVAAVPVIVWAGFIPGPVDGVAIGISVTRHPSDPWEGYPAAIAGAAPGALEWWVVTAAWMGTAVTALGSAAVRVDRWRGRRRIGLRPYDPRALVTPRSFARPRDVRELEGPAGGDSWSLLRVDRREIGTGPESHVLAIGPPRSGKSMALATPWIVESPGAVVTTSTKRELVGLTHRCRSEVGPCWVYAPLVPRTAVPVGTASWSPLPGCEDWDTAQLVAHWLGEAGTGGHGRTDESAAARFWNTEAVKLLGALLHAAALDPERCSMASVVGWVDGGAETVAEPLDLLAAGHPSARSRLDGIAGQDGRTLSYTLISAGQLIAAYRLLAAQESERDGPPVDVDALIDGRGTLFLLAPESRQALVAPLFAALLGQVFEAVEQRTLVSGPVDPPVRFVLDEAAQLAALASLPERLAVTTGQGARIASLWQSFAQVRHRFGGEADTVVASSHARIVLGPVVDEATRRLVSDLLDEQPALRRTRRPGPFGLGPAVSVQEVRERKASAQALQQLERWRGLAVVGSHLPIVGQVRPHWKRPAVRRALSAAERPR